MKKRMKILLLLCSALPLLVSGQKDKKILFSISNSSGTERKQELVSIVWKEIIAEYPLIDTADFKVINGKTKKEIPFQLEYRGESTIQNLLIQIDVLANGTADFYLQKGRPVVVNSKTFCRFVPERKDDFAWENDKIAFRMYGKALELTPKEMGYGIDVWVKRTDRLILNERYKRGEYHIDHGDGLDYYHVGYTLGAGNMMPYINDSIYYSRNYVRYKILDNGPLRSTFQLIYDEWEVAGRKVKAIKTISLDAGSQLNRIEVNYSFVNDTAALPVVVGIIKRKEPGTLLQDEQKGIMGYWEPEHGQDGTTAVGSVILSPLVKMKVTSEQLLAQTFVRNSVPFVYYTGAAWNKAGLITHAQAWFNYLQLFKDQLLHPLLVKFL